MEEVMEAEMYAPLWSGLFAVCLVLLYIYGSRSLKTWTKLGVPGPKPLPFLGNTHQIMWYKSNRLGKGMDDLFDQYGKIIGVYVFNQPTLIVKDLDALKEVLVKDFNNFTDRCTLGGGFLPAIFLNGLILQTGNAWRRGRQSVSPSFSISKLKTLTCYINNTSRQLIKKFEHHVDEGTMPASKDVFNALSFDVITGTAFGINLDTQNNIHGEMFQNMNRLSEVKPSVILGLFVAHTFPFLNFLTKIINLSVIDNRCLEFFVKLVRKWIRERKCEQDDADTFRQSDSDILQSLLHDKNSNITVEGKSKSKSKTLSSDDVVSQMLSILIAGYETTSRAMQFLTYSIAKHPDVQDRLVEEIRRVVGDEKEEISYEMCQRLRYMDAVILETLRMYPPVIHLIRQAVNRTSLKGFPVPKGAAVYGNLYNLGRNPEFYPDPDKFKPGRFFSEGFKSESEKNPTAGGVGSSTSSSSSSSSGGAKQQHATTTMSSVGCLAFGLGPRQCIGMKFAMMEMKIAMVHTLRKFVLVDATPDDLELDDFNGLLNVRIPMKLKLARRDI